MNLEDSSFNIICDILRATRVTYGDIYLVGGYVRDYLLGKQSHDFDFLVSENSELAARHIADSLGGHFYMLDKKRGTARALLPTQPQTIVDVALINGKDLIEDLKKRDFTINAMALDLFDLNTILDPLNGRSDLEEGEIKLCNENALIDDPLRTLRSVRFIRSLNLNYDDQLKHSIIEASKRLMEISPERIHDELCELFNLAGARKTLDLLIEFHLFDKLFPDLIHLRNIPAREPHTHDVFNHTLRVVEQTGLFICGLDSPIQDSINIFIDDVQDLTFKYRAGLLDYLEEKKARKLFPASLMVLAALYHDSGKTSELFNDKEIKKITYCHAEKSAELVYKRMKSLAFSNEEIHLVTSVVLNHMAADFKKIGGSEVASRNIYRYFKKTGSAGVMLVFLHLADLIATYEETMPASRWALALNSAEKILDGWFIRYNEVISPPKLITGNDLMRLFNLRRGKKIGKILEIIKEEQAAGIISDRDEALKFAELLITDGSITDD